MNLAHVSSRSIMHLIATFLILLIPSSMCTKQYKAIIIGAGSSGIAAATKLLENNVSDILILEAESRTGGRINTVDFDGAIVELGAEWCHGEKNNVVYETVKEKNLLDLLHHDEMPTRMYLSSRENISEELSNELFQLAIDAYYMESNVTTKESMAAVVGKWYNQQINTKYGNDKEKLKIFKWNSEFLRHITLCVEGSFSWDDSSFSSDFEESEGYFNLGWKNNGYKTFLSILMKKYPDPKEQLSIDDKILLDKQVTRVLMNEGRVDIFCSDNSSYRAERVIFTPSLGVLKEKASSLFEPKLPESKLLAIERIGMGAVMKVFLKYESKWWGKLPGFNFIWTEDDRAASKQLFPDGPTNKNGESWITEMYNIISIPDSNVLMVWFTGEMLPIIEKMDENVLVKGIEFTINKFLGHLFTIPRSQKMLRSNWYSNPHFRGSYSFSSVNSTGTDILNLQAPITDATGKPVLLFAGEATNLIHHSTVHGAVESGFREANRLIESFKN